MHIHPGISEIKIKSFFGYQTMSPFIRLTFQVSKTNII